MVALIPAAPPPVVARQVFRFSDNMDTHHENPKPGQGSGDLVGKEGIRIVPATRPGS
jgi:hypothetical protein